MSRIASRPISGARTATIKKLIEYGERLGNGAVFKRLGFLAESVTTELTLAELCRARLTAGNAKLDPALDCKRLVSRWRLLHSANLEPGRCD